MRVLLFTSGEPDYLQDSVLHGFKELLGEAACDYPTKVILYDDYESLSSLYGGGFTLYGLVDTDLKSCSVDNLEHAFRTGSYDLVVFTSIHRQYQLFDRFYPLLTHTKVCVLDGEDSDIIFPYYWKFLKSGLFGARPKPHRLSLYFKRELTGNSLTSYYLRFFPVFLKRLFKRHKNIRPISFAIPNEKVCRDIPVKTKLFTQHIVDEEIANVLPGKSIKYAFSSEQEYYNDIQNSRFGITTRRAGWDCLRHYEIAANRAVMCFKNLELKPSTCAPHGLIPGMNCIAYKSYDDLMSQINALSPDSYNEILANSLTWINQNTTIERAKQLLGWLN